MTPTVLDVYTLARSVLGDDEVQGGQIFTNTYLAQHLQGAYADLHRSFTLNGLDWVQRGGYYNVPANTAYLLPETAGLLNFGAPIPVHGLGERSVRNTSTVTAAALSTSPPGLDLTTAAPHSFLDGQTVVTFGLTGVSDDANDLWTVTIPGASTVRLMGAQPTLSGAAVTGTISDSNDQDFTDIESIPLFVPPPVQPGGKIQRYNFSHGAFRFYPASVDRQLRFWYTLAGTAPSSGSVGVPDSLEYLAYRTAARAAASKGATTVAAALNLAAVGSESGDIAGGDGGYLGGLVHLGRRALQRNRYVTPRFRPRRNVGPFGYYSSW